MKILQNFVWYLYNLSFVHTVKFYEKTISNIQTVAKFPPKSKTLHIILFQGSDTTELINFYT